MSGNGEARVTASVRPAVARSTSQSAVDDPLGKIGDRISERGVGVEDNLPTERALCKHLQKSRNTARDALGNKPMLDVYKIMKPVILKIMVGGKTRRTFSITTLLEHADIITAPEARDRVADQYRMKTHLLAGFPHLEE